METHSEWPKCLEFFTTGAWYSNCQCPKHLGFISNNKPLTLQSTNMAIAGKSPFFNRRRIGSGQIRIFHQPRFPWNSRRFPLLKHYLGEIGRVFGCDEIWPDWIYPPTQYSRKTTRITWTSWTMFTLWGSIAIGAVMLKSQQARGDCFRNGGDHTASKKIDPRLPVSGRTGASGAPPGRKFPSSHHTSSRNPESCCSCIPL